VQLAERLLLLEEVLPAAAKPAAHLDDVVLKVGRVLGVGDRFLVEDDLKFLAVDLVGKVEVLGDGVVVEGDVVAEDVGAECARRSRHHEDVVHVVLCELVDVLANRVLKRDKSCSVAAGPSQTGDDAGTDRVDYPHEYDWYTPCSPLQRSQSKASWRD